MNTISRLIKARYEYGYLDKVTSVTRDGLVIETLGWDGIGLVARGDTVFANEAHISGGVPLVATTSDSSEASYFDSDYLGTTTASYTAQGEVSAFVQGSFGQGTEFADARFTCKHYDADLGAHVFPFRNYRSDAGRWTSADPAGFPDGPNQHFYAPVPTMGLDSLGLAVYFASHFASEGSGSLGNHAKLVIVPDNPSEIDNAASLQPHPNGVDQYYTHGAGPENYNPLNWGNLEGGVNRPTDQDLSNTTFYGEITLPEGMTDTEFINHLNDLASNYNDNLPYQMLNQNSNSYIAGLIAAAGGGLPEGLDTTVFPRFNLPLDPSEF